MEIGTHYMNAIIVRSTNAVIRTIPARNGKPEMKFIEQRAAIDTGEEFPQPFNLTLDEGQQPYTAGTYYVCPSSFRPNQYGGLELGRRIKLQPLPSPVAPQLEKARA